MLDKMIPLPITAYSAVSACGLGNDALLQALIKEESGLAPLELFSMDRDVFVGEVTEDLPMVQEALKHFATRNAQIALATLECDNQRMRKAVQAAVAKYGAARVGVIIGTSTSGMYETELAYSAYKKSGKMPEGFDFLHQHAWGATADYLKEELDVQGPCYAISTACSSSSKAIASAERLISAGICDAVIAGGVDSICQLTLHGFQSLELVSEKPCTPLDQLRSGISLGEGGGLLLLEKPAAGKQKQGLYLLGYGESSDAYHMTAPQPEGEGAHAAMTQALKQSRLSTDDIDYLNLHATGTLMNDACEMKAVYAMFGDQVCCSGTKGVTGHTLGAAGAIESIISLLAIEHGFVPGTQGLAQVDESFSCPVLANPEKKEVRVVMNNNFGFGGNNASLIFGAI